MEKVITPRRPSDPPFAGFRIHDDGTVEFLTLTEVERLIDTRLNEALRKSLAALC